ncbi:MAG: carbohydrate-binding domain-containing protein [Chloroflexota bacterium]
MNKGKIVVLLTWLLVLSMLAACGGALEPVSSAQEQVTGAVVNSDPTAVATAAAATESSQAAEETVAGSVAEAAAENSQDHDDASDYVWDSAQVVNIALNGSTIAADGAGVTVDGSTATITAAGTYSLSGSLIDGQIVVDTQDEATVRLVLNGVEIHSNTSAPIYVANAEETVIILADNSENYFSDGESYVFADPEEDEPNAALFSQDDLTLSGGGSLTVEGHYNDGIASKDGLVISGGTITVNAVDDGIRGKDYLVVKGGTVTVTAQGDGLKSDKDQDAAKGYIAIEGGIIHVTSGGDAIQAQTDVMIAAGKVTLTAGGGNNSRIDAETSAKGIKAGVSVHIDGGAFDIDAADDAIHSNGSLVINDGAFVMATGDDAIHADSTLEINGGQIHIRASYEGLESAVITINEGDFYITSSDDAINVAGGNDASGTNWGPGAPPGGGPGRGGMPGQDTFAYSGDYFLYINGGYIVIDAGGDGLDSNGAIEMTGGVVVVNGPTENMNGALDYLGSFNITGGFLVAAGSAGMAEAPSESSTQNSVLLNLNGTLQAGTLIHIRTSGGDEILTFVSIKPYQSIVLSAPELAIGTTYEVYYGGSSTGAEKDGLYQGGSYTAGSPYTSFTVSSVVTRLGSFRR